MSKGQKMNQVVACLGELGLHCTPEQLKNPKAEFFHKILRRLVSEAMGISIGDNPLSFPADLLEDPSLHEKSPNQIAWLVYLSQLMRTLQIPNFSLYEDVLHPTKESVQRIIVPILSFISFRQSRMQGFADLSLPCTTLREEQLELEETLRCLRNEMDQLLQLRSEDEPELLEIKADIQSQMKKLEKLRSQLATEEAKLAQKWGYLKQQDAKNQKTKSRIEILTTEKETLEQQIIPPPEEIQTQIAQLKKTEAHLQRALREEENDIEIQHQNEAEMKSLISKFDDEVKQLKQYHTKLRRDMDYVMNQTDRVLNTVTDENLDPGMLKKVYPK